MHSPPDHLDGARVLFWAWRDDPPFFVMDDGGAGIAICGLAVARYDSGSVYRFSCDRDWQVMGDWDHPDTHSALTTPHGGYDVARVEWAQLGS